MKHFNKKIFCSTLSFILILCSVLPATAAQITSRTAVAQEPKMFADSNVAEYQSIDTDALMAQIKEAVINCEEVIDIRQYNIPFSQQTLNSFYATLANEMAEAFHVTGVSCTYSGGKFLTLNLSYACTAEEYKAQYEACTNAADKLLSGIKNNSDLTDVEKALLLHDRLALHCAYGNVFADRYETATLYGALVKRKPVCQGYAIAYSYLLEQVGIKSELVSSVKLNHAWNIVYIDNTPYHVDVTWDDPVPDAYGRVMHNNFLLSTNALKKGINGSKGHNADDFTSTPVNTKYDAYYWQNSEASFQLLNGEIYYIDNLVNEELRRLSDNATICSLSDTWFISSDNFYMPGNYSKLACVNNTLYCSMPTGIYEINTQTNTMTEFKKPALSINGETFYSIYGFAYEDNILYFDYANKVADNIHFAKTSISVGVPACTHPTTQIQNKVNATCATDGYTGDYYCKSCGMKTADGTVIPKTGNHEWDAGKLTTIPTCHETGVITFTCTVCTNTKKQTVAIDVGNHSGETEIIGKIDALCNTDGYTGDEVCLGCNAVLKTGSVIPALGTHTWDKGVITIQPTQSTEGEKTYTCTLCGDTKTEKISAADAFINKDGVAIMDANGNILALSGTTVSQYLTQASEGSIITDKNGSILLDNAIPGTGSLLVTPSGKQYLILVVGDVNGDGKILANDARSTLRASVGLDSITDIQHKAGDVTGDGEVTASDARSILRASVGLENPVNWLA